MNVPKWDELTTEEQNLLVAEKVMGFEPGLDTLPPRYAESMGLALAILERYQTVAMAHDNAEGLWRCLVYSSPYAAQGVHRNLVDASCLAALMIEGAGKSEVYVEYTYPTDENN